MQLLEGRGEERLQRLYACVRACIFAAPCPYPAAGSGIRLGQAKTEYVVQHAAYGYTARAVILCPRMTVAAMVMVMFAVVCSLWL